MFHITPPSTDPASSNATLGGLEFDGFAAYNGGYCLDGEAYGSLLETDHGVPYEQQLQALQGSANRIGSESSPTFDSQLFSNQHQASGIGANTSFRDNINLQLKLGGSFRQNSPINQYYGQSPAPLVNSHNTQVDFRAKRVVISPVVIAKTPAGKSDEGMEITKTNIHAYVDSSMFLSTPPLSPTCYLNFDSMYESVGSSSDNLFGLENEALAENLHDGFFNYKEIDFAATNIAPMMQDTWNHQEDALHKHSLQSESAKVAELQRQLQAKRKANLEEERARKPVHARTQTTIGITKKPKKRKASSKTETCHLDTSLDVKTAIELAAKAFSNSFGKCVRNGNNNAPLSPASVSSSMSTPKVHDNEHRVVKMTERLLERFDLTQLQEMVVSEKEFKCINHCDIIFNNYFELAQHYDEFKLFRHQPRSYVCPVQHCPMNIIGYNKKLLLKQHVVSQHFSKGHVLPEFERYSEQLHNTIFTCEHQDCRKGFYRRDSLTRHYKLVHANAQSYFNLKKGKDPDEPDFHGTRKKRRTR